MAMVEWRGRADEFAQGNCSYGCSCQVNGVSTHGYVEARRARLNIPGLLEATGEPIRNPVTGAEHRARIDLPHGFEYRIAEIGSGTTRATGAIKLDLKNSYGQFA